MKKSFYYLLVAQFLSALADNALLFVAIKLLDTQHAPDWHKPLLLQFFVISYIVLAPFVGIWADAWPKAQVMFVANAIKLLGSLGMLVGVPPLYAYSIVGIGAAAYSPAKYGILTELLPVESLVDANGWIEGSTVTAIILGALIGGFAASYDLIIALVTVSLTYLLAAAFNLFIPKLQLTHARIQKNPLAMLGDFYHAFMVLWRDPLGQVSLTVTTLFWGAGATLRLVVLSWAGIVLGLSFDGATLMTVYVAIGIAIGALLASRLIQLKSALKVLPAGIVMGALVMTMVLVYEQHIAALMLGLIGVLSGFFVVPLNALLQHRGHLLIGAGHSIAVQNFNENIGILLLSGGYTLMVKHEIDINHIILVFGLFVLISMLFIQHRYYQQRPLQK